MNLFDLLNPLIYKHSFSLFLTSIMVYVYYIYIYIYTYRHVFCLLGYPTFDTRETELFCFLSKEGPKVLEREKGKCKA